MGLLFPIQLQAGLTGTLQYSMELDPHVSDHAASMLASLNLQRGQVQFCDCLIRQRQSPSQFYPAHRCVLAASSPVLASILSSNSTLVELQDPCLSDSVLANLFDYIYTGTLPNIRSQHQYYSLITAAHYLQMDELQEALRAWQQTETYNGNDPKKTCAGPETVQYKDNASLTSAKCPPLSPSMNVFRQPTESLLDRVSSSERKDGNLSESVEMCYKAQTLSVKTGSNTKEGEKSTRTCSMKGDTSPTSKDGTLGDINTICSTSETTVNNHYIQVSPNLMENISTTADVQGVARVGKHGKSDLFHSMGIVKLHTWQRSKEEDLFRTVKDERRSDSLCGVAVQEKENSIAETTQHLNSTLNVEAEDKQANAQVKKLQSLLPPLFSSPVSLYTLCNNASPSQSTTSFRATSPPPRFGAVSVICHSSRAAVVQVTEASTRPPYHPVSHRASVLQSTYIDNKRIVKGIVPQHRTCNGEHNQDYRGNRDHLYKKYLEDKDSFGQCVLQDLCYKSNTDQSDTLKRDYNSRTTDHCIMQKDKQKNNTLPHITSRTVGKTYGQSLNATKHVKDESLLQNNDGFRFGSGHPSPSHFPTKHQRLKYNECKDFSLDIASRQSIHSHDKTPAAPVTAQESYKGQEFNTEMMCLKTEAKEGHSSSCRKERSQCVHESKANESQKNGVYLAISNAQDLGLDNVRRSLSAFEHSTSLEPKNMSTTKTLEPTESTMSYPMFDFVEQSYKGQLHYHCLSQEDTHLSFGQTGYRQSESDYSDHGDQSSDEKEVYANPLRQHSPTMNEDVVLLDISTKPTELFVSYKHKSRQGDEVGAFGKTDTFDMIWNNHGDTRDTSNNRNITTDFESGGFVKDNSEAWIQETSAEHRKPVGTSQPRPGRESIHKTEPWVLEETSKDSGKQTNKLTSYTSACVQGSVKTTMPSTSSIYIAPTLSNTMPTNISAHLSTPEHHLFQCSLCDRCFSQRGSLNRHVRSHLGVRPFPCPQCPMTFSRQYRVTEHMRVHQRCNISGHFQKPPV